MGKAKDVTGDVFGKLTAIKISGKDNYGRNKWLFKCACGNKTEASLNNVLTGSTKSCGCLKNLPHRRIELTGKRFGRLYVLNYAETKKGNAMWACLCDCGRKVNVSSLKLSHNRTKSCGCLQKEVRLGLYRADNPNNCAKWARDLKTIFENCAKCGSKERLHTHHIKPYGVYPSQRKDYTNGIVLCEKCHKEFHARYGFVAIGVDTIGEYLALPPFAIIALTLLNGHRNKNGAEDIKKAIHYCELLLQLEYGATDER